jgi:trk system potassium uptake protein TrkH
MPSRLFRLWQRMSAAQIAILSFAGIILLGTLLLLLPVSNTGPRVSVVDALFTSTSAMCVTGLTVVDPGTTYTAFGEAVIVILIQLGGFGILALSTFFLFMLGRRTSLRVADGASETYPKMAQYSLREMLRKALFFTLGFEGLGALVLFLRWLPDYSAGTALWQAVFHSVSAFCNAGFSLYPENLVRYAGDPVTNLTVMGLIVCGGIGFFVMIDLWGALRRRSYPGKHRLSFHTKVVLTVTAFLIPAGALAIFGLEHGGSMAGLRWDGALLRSFFQSVTARTAGFNTVDIARLSNASLYVLIMLMFIGGAPGSTAGGVKVTAVGVLWIVVLSRLRGLERSSMFGRSLNHSDIERALTLIVLAVVMLSLFTMALLVVQLGSVSHQESEGTFLAVLFEYVSAFGTVGLSMNFTPTLTTVGRLLIVLVMFIGRLGPLTLIVALESRRARARFHYPQEEVMIG